MQTRRDQLHAYRFMTRRAMSALVTGEPDTVEPPMRRLTVTTLSGVMIAIVVAAAFAIIGLLSPGGGDAWREDGTVIIERETGARYVMIDGELRPALNYASAVLAATAEGASGPAPVELVPRDDLASVERGSTIGDPNLPDSMPEKEELVKGPITVCSQPDEGQDVRVTARVTVDVGGERPSRMVPEDQGVYVEGVDGRRYLLWNGRRHEIAEGVRLDITESPVVVGKAFLNALPAGQPFEPPTVPRFGERSQDPGAVGLTIGQVIQDDGGSGASWVLLDDGITPVTEVQKTLFLAIPNSPRVARRSPSDLDIDESEATAEALKSTMDQLPAEVPEVASEARTAGGACALYKDGAATPELAVPDGTVSRQPDSDSPSSQQGKADAVTLKRGAALLAKSPLGKTVYLVAEPGAAYPAASLETLAGFGYGEVEPVVLPVELLSTLPAGAGLDPAKALVTAGE